MTNRPAKNPPAKILQTDKRNRVRRLWEEQEALLGALEKSGMSGEAFAGWEGLQ